MLAQCELVDLNGRGGLAVGWFVVERDAAVTGLDVYQSVDLVQCLVVDAIHLCWQFAVHELMKGLLSRKKMEITALNVRPLFKTAEH